MEQETRGCVSRMVSRVTRVPGGKYPIPAIPGPRFDGRAGGTAVGTPGSATPSPVVSSPTPPRRTRGPCNDAPGRRAGGGAALPASVIGALSAAAMRRGPP